MVKRIARSVGSRVITVEAVFNFFDVHIAKLVPNESLDRT
ncbi:hypothetical protein ES703_103270 [subsurface metagenome]